MTHLASLLVTRLNMQTHFFHSTKVSALRLYTMDAMFPAVFPTSVAIKHRLQIQDDLYAIFHYASAAIQFVNKITTGGLVPWQFDFTIFPQKIFKDNGLVYTDRTTPILSLQEDVIGDIRTRFEFGKVDYHEHELNTKDLTTERVLSALNDLFSRS